MLSVWKGWGATPSSDLVYESALLPEQSKRTFHTQNWLCSVGKQLCLRYFLLKHCQAVQCPGVLTSHQMRSEATLSSGLGYGSAPLHGQGQTSLQSQRDWGPNSGKPC